jgi:hypothetical protein
MGDAVDLDEVIGPVCGRDDHVRAPAHRDAAADLTEPLDLGGDGARVEHDLVP